MKRGEYERRMNALHNKEGYSLGPDRWNEEYRTKLARAGFKLTEVDPGDDSFYFQAPLPTPGGDGEPTSPDIDPHSWPVPSWIVPDKEKQG